MKYAKEKISKMTIESLERENKSLKKKCKNLQNHYKILQEKHLETEERLQRLESNFNPVVEIIKER